MCRLGYSDLPFPEPLASIIYPQGIPPGGLPKGLHRGSPVGSPKDLPRGSLQGINPCSWKTPGTSLRDFFEDPPGDPPGGVPVGSWGGSALGIPPGIPPGAGGYPWCSLGDLLGGFGFEMVERLQFREDFGFEVIGGLGIARIFGLKGLVRRP